jgi:hypothetical protein
VTIAEVEELVPAGELDPDAVHTPGIYVQRVVQGDRMGLIERLTLADAPSESFSPRTNPNDAMRERIVRRAALELSDGDYVNLGASLPHLAAPDHATAAPSRTSPAASRTARLSVGYLSRLQIRPAPHGIGGRRHRHAHPHPHPHPNP